MTCENNEALLVRSVARLTSMGSLMRTGQPLKRLRVEWRATPAIVKQAVVCVERSRGWNHRVVCKPGLTGIWRGSSNGRASRT